MQNQHPSVQLLAEKHAADRANKAEIEAASKIPPSPEAAALIAELEATRAEIAELKALKKSRDAEQASQ